MDSLTLTINGEARDINCDPATPLLYVLRNDLDLTGAKLGCGLEQCGACAVLVGAAQCGYCTAGLVIAATSLLKANAAPDRDAIVAGLEEHLCRCGSHGRVIAAIGRAAKEIGNV
jgi:nicotinate dehydrogenase subunit A